MSNPYVPYVLGSADQYGVPRQLALKLVNQESGFNPRAVSGAGAIGLTQLMPGTAQDMGVDPWDPIQNIDGGMHYLGNMLKQFKSTPLALAAYNAGPGRVAKYLNGQSGLPAETTNYVNAINNTKLPENKGNTMAPQPALSAQAVTGGPGALFSGSGDRGGYDLGDHMQRAAAWLETIYNPAAGAALLKVTDPLGRNKFGLNPVWGKDANGKYVPMQMNSGGGLVPLQMPQGVDAVLPTTTVNMGGYGTGVLRRGDTSPTTIIPKAGPIGTDERPNPQGTGYEAVPGSQTEGKITPRETRDRGVKGIQYNLGQLTDDYTKLHDNAGISGPANGIADNLKNAEAYVSNSSVGQVLGRVFGTQNQSTRNEINSLRPALINSIRSATGMSARAMDSDTELKFYMQQATDPQNDYMSNLAAIENLDNQYGLGGVLKQHLSPDVYKQVQQRAVQMRSEHPFSNGSAQPDSGGATSMPGGITIRRIK